MNMKLFATLLVLSTFVLTGSSGLAQSGEKAEDCRHDG